MTIIKVLDYKRFHAKIPGLKYSKFRMEIDENINKLSSMLKPLPAKRLSTPVGCRYKQLFIHSEDDTVATVVAINRTAGTI